MIGVDGMWAAWDEWSTCSMTCNGGERQRSRTCTNPKPVHPGRKCDGRHWERDDCNQQVCPAIGKTNSDLALGIKSVLSMKREIA